MLLHMQISFMKSVYKVLKNIYYLFTQIDSSYYSVHKIIIIIKVTKKYTIIKIYDILYFNYCQLYLIKV